MTEEGLDPDALIHQRVGTVVAGKYTLDRVIGIGAMAAVYAATHRNQAEFAIKLLHPELSSNEEIRTRFLREGYIANSVKHEGAVRVVDDDVTEDGAALLVMELLRGTSVEDLWFQNDRVVPVRPALAIAFQLLDVLAAAHAKNIVHRDIKPANLFVTKSGDLKVLDFGIARLRDPTKNAVTQVGTMMGTPAFMAPEQARGQTKDVDGRTDVWAVGATLFSLISGNLVHEADSMAMLLVQAGTTPARSLGTVARDVPESIVTLVDKALAFQKTERWESAAAMRDALGVAYAEAFGEPVTREVLHQFYVHVEHTLASEAAAAPDEAPAGKAAAEFGGEPGPEAEDRGDDTADDKPATPTERVPEPAKQSALPAPARVEREPQPLAAKTMLLEPARRPLAATLPLSQVPKEVERLRALATPVASPAAPIEALPGRDLPSGSVPRPAAPPVPASVEKKTSVTMLVAVCLIVVVLVGLVALLWGRH